MGRYINDAPRHENECNANIEKIIVDYKPALVLFARRFINAGEEIKYDYGVKNLPWRCKEVNKCVFQNFRKKNVQFMNLRVGSTLLI